MLGGRDSCKAFMNADDIEHGFEAISTRLLMHLGQEHLTHRFQEFSPCWSMLGCHETKRVEVDTINQVPITMIFGEKDSLSDQKK